MLKSFFGFAATTLILLASAITGPASTSYGFFIDGDGHYAVMGETETQPGYVKNNRGMYEAVRQSFRLLGEVRPNDRTSMFVEFRLFKDPRKSYLGDTAQPQECSTSNNSNTGSSTDCTGRHQDPTYPAYQAYVPMVTQAYARYSSEYCLIEAGRRTRDWGIGMFLNSGAKPFDAAMSVYDGISCEINIQQMQTLGFSFGYDKLAESGGSKETPDLNEGFYRYGGTARADDIDQFFVTIEYDDRKANAGSAFTRQIGFYIANVLERGYKTDIKYADFYSGFFFPSFSIRNEVLFRLGKSSDPSWTRLGGRSPYPFTDAAAPEAFGTTHRNELDSIAVAGNIDVTLARSGSFLGPSEYQQGNASRHALLLDYIYAPGDRDGYLTEYDATGNSQRNSKVTAIALNRNFKPALLMFNGRAETDDLRVDGIFDPNAVMNASVIGLAYRYESVMYGNFEPKLITAQLIQSIPAGAKAYYETLTDADGNPAERPVGFAGKSLGYELDLRYWRNIGKDLEFGFAGAVGLPGAAWQTKKDAGTTTNYLLQSHLTFNF